MPIFGTFFTFPAGGKLIVVFSIVEMYYSRRKTFWRNFATYESFLDQIWLYYREFCFKKTLITPQYFVQKLQDYNGLKRFSKPCWVFKDLEQIPPSFQVIPYSDDGYIRLGRNVARTFLDYYELLPIPPAIPPSSPPPPVNKSKLKAQLRDEVLMVHRQRSNANKLDHYNMIFGLLVIFL